MFPNQDKIHPILLYFSSNYKIFLCVYMKQLAISFIIKPSPGVFIRSLNGKLFKKSLDI